MRRTRLGAAVVWDGGTEDFICRDERCALHGMHLAHDIIDTPEVVRARHFVWGWSLDPLEPIKTTGSPPKRRACEPNRRGRPIGPRVLDEIILSVISRYTVKPFRTVHQDVTDTYGSVDIRRMHRRLESLRKHGEIVYLAFDPGKLISGYTTPDSSLLRDPVAIEEILWRQVTEAA